MKKKSQYDISLSTILICFGLFFVSGLKAQHRMDARMDSTGHEIFTPYNRPSTPVQSTTEPATTTEQTPDTFRVNPMVPWVKASKTAKLKAASANQPTKANNPDNISVPQKSDAAPLPENKQVNSPK